MIARSLELMPPHGQKSGVREAGVMVVYVLYTLGIELDYEIKHIKLIRNRIHNSNLNGFRALTKIDNLT